MLPKIVFISQKPWTTLLWGVILWFLEAIFSANSANFQLDKGMILAPDIILHQHDSSSCGVFACMNAYSLVCDNMDSLYTSENYWQHRALDGIPLDHRLINALLSLKQPGKRQQSSMELIPINYISANVLDIKKCSYLRHVKSIARFSLLRNQKIGWATKRKICRCSN